MDQALLYLNTPPNSQILPPIETKHDMLPIESLRWEDFEKLILTICQITYAIDDCEIYGIKGQKQDGIDIFAKRENGKYASYQCKRYQTIKETDLRNAVTEFKQGAWFDKSDQFIFCTTASLNKAELQEEFNDLENDLRTSGVDFIKWDKIQICRTLKNHPNIVYAFFGREWTRIFNGEERLTLVTQRTKLDSIETSRYRKELYTLYNIVFNNHDTGIPIQEVKMQSFALQERFIMPDALQEAMPDDFYYFESEPEPRNPDLYDEFEEDNVPAGYYNSILNNESHQKKQEQLEKISAGRTAVDGILIKNLKSIVLGDPGSGKSTLLRNIILDILSDSPRFPSIANHWGKKLPIWLPFAYITKQLATDENKSLSDLLKLWLKSHDREHLFELIKDALSDQRLFLVIDGIDEYTSDSSARQAISKIEIQAELTNIAVLYSSRPYGYKLLSDSFSKLTELHLLPFTQIQQQEYCLFWYKRWLKSLKNEDIHYANSQANNFIEDLNKSHELRDLAKNPLLLSILITQRFRDGVLPNNRIKALDIITEYLTNIHPKKRNISASILNSNSFNFELIEVFEKLAIHMQKNVNEGIIEKYQAKKVIEEYLIELMGYKTPEAHKYSDDIFNIGANHYGIIIEKSNEEIAFTHRLFQEFLAARYLYKSDDEFKEVLSQYGNNSGWYQVIKFYFSLIPNNKSKLFKESLAYIKDQSKKKELVSGIELLKYDIALTLNNAPIDLSREKFKDIIRLFEIESNRIKKKRLWNILLESLSNLKIKDEVQKYLFSYFPNYYKFGDYRIVTIRNIEIGDLTTIQKNFLVKSLINSDANSKLAVSYTIKKFIADTFLFNSITTIIDKDFNPEIIAFALNCLISEDVDYNTKLNYLEKYKNSEHPILLFFIIKLKVHLKIHSDSDLETFVAIQANLGYNFRNEVINVLSEGWPKNKNLLRLCLKSVAKHHYHESVTLDGEAAWKILFQSFNDDESVVDRIISELDTEEYPFLMAGDHHGWAYIATYFKGNKKLIPALDSWIPKQKFSEPEISYASQVGRTETIKKYLIGKLPDAHFSHWISNALVEGWPDDIEVTTALKKYFLGDFSNKGYSAHYISSAFRDDKATGIKLLEEIIFDLKSHFPERAITGLIQLDREYFRKNILEKYIVEQLPKVPENDSFGIHQTIVFSIVENFGEEKIVKDYVFKNLINKPDNIHAIIRYYPKEAEVIDNLLQISLPLQIDLRLALIERLKELGMNDTAMISQLSKFKIEAEETVRCTAAINYFNILKDKDAETILDISRKDVFYRGFDFQVQRQISFCGYLITKSLPEYLLLKEEDTNDLSSPHIPFESYHKLSKALIKLIIDNFEYLNIVLEGDFTRLNRNAGDSAEYFWSFWAQHSDKSSPTFKYINNFIQKYEGKISSLQLINFLDRTSPTSSVLRKICLRLLNDEDSKGVIAGEIMANNFKDDNVYQELININQPSIQAGKIVALCIGWPSAPILKTIFENASKNSFAFSRDAGYHLKFLFRDAAHIMDFFSRQFQNYREAMMDYRYFIKPLLIRVRKDVELLNMIKIKLLVAASGSEKISFFAILKYVNKMDLEILSWRDRQLEEISFASYGYNIMDNKLSVLSNVLVEDYQVYIM